MLGFQAHARLYHGYVLVILTQQGMAFKANASLHGSVRGRDKIFGAINFWVLFNREYNVRINRIGARARPSCPARSVRYVQAASRQC